MSTQGTKKTRFLIISDTHEAPLFPASDTSHAFRKPLPRADVLLHCGDLTMTGARTAYESVIQMLGTIDAELKLVIAGNHDLTLDKQFCQSHQTRSTDAHVHDDAVALWTGPAAQAAGVTYLNEGTHRFTLASGATFTLYASPYQPEFCDWAFPYERNEDRFNPAAHASKSAVCIAENPVPDFPAVDVVMTHGPPLGRLDLCANGNVGCEHLMRAVRRARPRLLCFGHIHEGWGAERVLWRKSHGGDARSGGSDAAEDGGIERVESVEVDREKASEQMCVYVDASKGGGNEVVLGESTLMVNAAIMTLRYKPLNAPWLVDLDLPAADAV